MEKIELPDECKALLLAMAKVPHVCPNHKDDTDKWLEVLSYYGLVEGTRNSQGEYILSRLSQKGKTYLTLNPELKNPSFWDDKHAIISHICNLFGIINLL